MPVSASADILFVLNYTNTQFYSSVMCQCCGHDFLLFITLQDWDTTIPMIELYKVMIQYVGRKILSHQVIFFLCSLKLCMCFPLKYFWIVSFISYQSMVLDKIMAWQTLVPYISWLTSDDPYQGNKLLFFFYLSVATLSIVWNACV